MLSLQSISINYHVVEVRIRNHIGCIQEKGMYSMNQIHKI